MPSRLSEKIVIASAYQNRHIGRRCIAELLKVAEEKGMKQVYANVYAFNEQSRKMFLAVGFEQVGEEELRHTILKD